MPLYLAQGTVYGFAAAVQPGPFLAYLGFPGFEQRLAEGLACRAGAAAERRPDHRAGADRAEPHPAVVDTDFNGIGFLAGFYGAMVASMAGVVLLCACAGRRDDRLNRLLSGVSGIALAGFGLYQIALGITNWR